jgi:SAM-dependent methyltransferase
MSSFGTNYAEIYDALYEDKNYKAEANYVLNLFAKYENRRIDSLLEVGCGTGNHAKFLYEDGMKYVGIDSSPSMIELARKKQPKREFLVADATKIGRLGSFDCCVSLFHAFGYISDYRDVELALKGIKSNLSDEGLFIFDVWNGLSVIQSPPQATMRKGKTATGLEVIRYSTPEVDYSNNLVKIAFDLLLVERERVVSRFQELHSMRFYFPSELAYILHKNGFGEVTFFPFMKFNVDISVLDKSFVAVCKPSN